MESDMPFLGDSKSTIINCLGTGERTGKELASILHVNQNAIREHMLWLERLGLVKSKFVRGGVGRPRKVYYLSGVGVELLPKHYDTFLNVFIKKCAEVAGEETLGKVIADAVRELATGNTEMANLPPEIRLEKLVDMLNRIGFMATIEKKGNDVILVRHNCIFNKTAKLYPTLLCGQCDLNFVRSPIGNGVAVEQTECMGKGDQACKNLIHV
ncbi:MAG: ArsR family transcriptional regulator [Methanomassiliicoccales archaeon]